MLTEETNGIHRKRCRFERCRSKLPTPTENEHHAFCTPGCHTSFYRSRCLVCEAGLRKTGKRGDEQRRYCRPPNRCAAEARKWPEKYAFGVPPLSPPPDRGTSDSYIDSTGLKSRHKSLRAWQWVAGDLEHELRDAAGTPLARIESNAGRHRLTHPRTSPVLSWPDFEEAKHRAESIALTAPGLADIKADTKPNVMGKPLNRTTLIEDGIPAGRITGGTGDMPEIPEFLRRA